MENGDVINKLNRNKEIRREISQITEKIRLLKHEKKMNDIYIFNNCEHNWVLDRTYFQYDERPNRCTKCNLVKN
jgi:hypothetical protein